MPYLRIPNKHVRFAVADRREFDGSNLYGRKLNETDYAVFSYGSHWPVRAFIAGVWYENATREGCSSTTARHTGLTHTLSIPAIGMGIDELKAKIEAVRTRSLNL